MLLQVLTQDTSWITAVRPYLESAYFLSSVALVVIAAIALQQLRIAKDDIRIRARREAASLAALQHDRFIERVEPLWQEWMNAAATHGVPTLEDLPDGSVANFDESQLQSPEAIEWMSKSKPIRRLSINVLNALDAIAVYFLNGIADEELAFPAMGRMFCAVAEELRLVIAFYESKSPQSYNGVISLYNVWKERANRLHLENQVDALTGKLNNFTDRRIKPMGTE